MRFVVRRLGFIDGDKLALGGSDGKLVNSEEVDGVSLGVVGCTIEDCMVGLLLPISFDVVGLLLTGDTIGCLVGLYVIWGMLVDILVGALLGCSDDGKIMGALLIGLLDGGILMGANVGGLVGLSVPSLVSFCSSGWHES